MHQFTRVYKNSKQSSNMHFIQLSSWDLRYVRCGIEFVEAVRNIPFCLHVEPVCPVLKAVMKSILKSALISSLFCGLVNNGQ